MKAKLPAQASNCAVLSPLIKLCLIQRLTTEECLNLMEKNGNKMSERKWFSLKKEYNQGTTNRFLEIARNEWAEEHLLIIDKIKQLEQKLWEIFNNTEEEMVALKSIDQLSKLQDQLTLFYNETPLMAKMKETLEAKLEELNRKDAVNKA